MKIKYYIIFFIITLLASCSDSNNCLKRIGERKTLIDGLHSFHTLNINSVFDITIIDSALYSISIEGYSNILDLVEHKVVNGVLTLENKYECTWLKKEDCPKIIITAPKIDSVYINNACDLRSEGVLNYNNFFVFCFAKILNCDLTLNCHNVWFMAVATSGLYKLRGTANWVYLQNAGNGMLDAENFECYHLDLDHKSIGETKISCYGDLNILNIKYSYVYLFTSLCPNITFNNSMDKSLFFTENCM